MYRSKQLRDDSSSNNSNINPDGGHLVFGILVFVYAIVVLALGMNSYVNLYDEGLIVTGASRVAAGAIPHRDFYTNYGPGQFYALALAFKVFSPSILAERIWDLVIKAGIAWLVGAIALQMMARAFAVVVVGACILWLTFCGAYGYPLWPSLFLSLLSVSFLLPIFDRYSAGSLVAAGLTVGAITLFRYDVGFFSCVAESIVLVAFGYMAPRAEYSRIRSIGGLLIPLWLGVALVFVPLMIAYLEEGVIRDFIFQIIEFPPKHYAQTRSLPFPRLLPFNRIGDLSEFIVYLPPLAVVAAILAGLTGVRGESDGGARTFVEPWRLKLALMSLLTAIFYLKGIVRVSPIHMSLSFIPAFIALGAAADHTFERRRPIAMMAVGGALLVAGIPSLAAAIHVATQVSTNIVAFVRGRVQVANETISTVGSCWPPKYLERARCFIVPTQMMEALHFIELNTAPDEPLFVGDGRHDKIFVDNAAFYFIAGRPPVTKWYHFDPGLQSSQRIQSQMTAELEKSAPRYIVLDAEWDNVREPNESALSSGVTALDDYIARTYSPVVEFGTYRILERKPSLQGAAAGSPASIAKRARQPN